MSIFFIDSDQKEEFEKWKTEHDARIRADERKRLLKLAQCEEADCFECGMGNVDGCLLEMDFGE